MVSTRPLLLPAKGRRDDGQWSAWKRVPLLYCSTQQATVAFQALLYSAYGVAVAVAPITATQRVIRNRRDEHVYVFPRQGTAVLYPRSSAVMPEIGVTQLSAQRCLLRLLSTAPFFSADWILLFSV